MSLLIRLLLLIAAPITALFIARDELNFGIMQTLVAVTLVVLVLVVAALWPRPRKS
ncbi:hypothetical protein JQ557_07185 [Bradyrhizobium sp. U87765 SZCCT0131]|uniref:hypothetical protein n=1 Tax=unclassified Bradyrhizobium TaxID=2631580 RepID=UPI001BA51703|nr:MULTISPECIES: hypothetical protein [unclassified Bradyrhizobium]MBR1217765.1 hypothetical protein [Bradyrhizobium sp. U87765 SZCCT0131]MBR1261289.1 hypothetical protein [Bradyrhizobium sp. U87765 SZCCT0134]MBR1303263.1 hypothetical protein [Bradyrhizobium sp. U87765 SZCCT0110]MBR1318869.1 hypothetical protein [Bradyrhizobium sp. U87765 SZCCT0109]MBR1347194.1 hypothetical protein [Bradyrhizobium sp. U87765 SZCCT0048]